MWKLEEEVEWQVKLGNGKGRVRR
jgi:hypothetical protein